MNSLDSSFKLASPDIQARLKKIKLLILDVDGVMTDGRVFWLDGQGWTRYFYIHDGYGLKLLMKNGIQVAVISGGDSQDVRARTQVLNIPYVHLGDEDKLKALDQLLISSGFSLEEMAFIGDDLFDIPVLEKVGFSATVPQALPEVKARVHYVTTLGGGAGAVREIADAIRKAQGIGPYL